MRLGSCPSCLPELVPAQTLCCGLGSQEWGFVLLVYFLTSLVPYCSWELLALLGYEDCFCAAGVQKVFYTCCLPVRRGRNKKLCVGTKVIFMCLLAVVILMCSTIKLVKLPIDHRIKLFSIQQIQDISERNDALTLHFLIPRLFGHNVDNKT